MYMTSFGSHIFITSFYSTREGHARTCSNLFKSCGGGVPCIMRSVLLGMGWG